SASTPRGGGLASCPLLPERAAAPRQNRGARITPSKEKAANTAEGLFVEEAGQAERSGVTNVTPGAQLRRRLCADRSLVIGVRRSDIKEEDRAARPDPRDHRGAGYRAAAPAAAGVTLHAHPEFSV